MKLAQTSYDNSETGCCAKLDTKLWDEQDLQWKEKPFLKDHLRAILHIPLNFGSVISRDQAVLEQAEAYPEQPLWLTDEVSPWGSDLYLAVDREIPGVQIEKLSGRFLTKVFEGPYRNIGKWTRKMEEYVARKGQTLKKLYYFYATCPKCAKHFGQNHVVLFAQVE